jgi:hypothetical protein
VRTQDDLRLRRLVRSRFRLGRQLAMSSSIPGVHFSLFVRLSLFEEVRFVPRMCAHAVTRRCSWGLLAASFQLGKAFEMLRILPGLRCRPGA